jgi:hypothetical protein
MIQFVLVSALFLVMPSAFGQPDAASNVGGARGSKTGTAAITSPIPPGKYKGRVTQQGGDRSSDFDLDLTQTPGMLRMYRAPSPCNASLPVSITSVANGVVRFEAIPAVISGCDRVLELTVSGNELVGTLKAPTGIFDFKASKQ